MSRLCNDHFSDRWTSPCCYVDFTDGTRPGVHSCPSCGRLVRLSVERFPSAIAELVDLTEDEGEEA